MPRLDEKICPRCLMPRGEHVSGCLEAKGTIGMPEIVLPVCAFCGTDKPRMLDLKAELDTWHDVFPAQTPRVAKAIVIADATREAIKDHIGHMSRTEASLHEAVAEVERLRAKVESLEIQLADAKGA